MGAVKTTLELPDDLFRAIKLKAAREDRTIKDVTAELLRRGLASPPPGTSARRTAFPLITCPPGRPTGLAPDEVAATLLQADVDTLAEMEPE
jgi:plasmid stability protein